MIDVIPPLVPAISSVAVIAMPFVSAEIIALITTPDAVLSRTISPVFDTIVSLRRSVPWLVIVTSLAAVSDAGVLISPAALKSVILPAVATISASSLLASKRSPCVVESEMSPATALIAPVSVTPNFAFTSTS